MLGWQVELSLIAGEFASAFDADGDGATTVKEIAARSGQESGRVCAAAKIASRVPQKLPRVFPLGLAQRPEARPRAEAFLNLPEGGGDDSDAWPVVCSVAWRDLGGSPCWLRVGSPQAASPKTNELAALRPGRRAPLLASTPMATAALEPRSWAASCASSALPERWAAGNFTRCPRFSLVIYLRPPIVASPISARATSLLRATRHDPRALSQTHTGDKFSRVIYGGKGQEGAYTSQSKKKSHSARY